MLPRPLDTLLALKAINLIPELSATDKRVAGALIDHFNKKTGQCDPSHGRIAGLLAVSSRTVIRSINRLERHGLFRRKRHGGHLNRNSYEPVWPRFREIEAAWTSRFRSKTTHPTATKLSPAPCQPCHLDGDSPVTQTCRSNLSKETCGKRLPNKGKAEVAERRPARNSLANSAAKADPARVSAERRWSNDLHARFVSMPITYGQIIEAVDPAMQEAATDAELRRRGGGLAFLLRKLKLGDAR
jgi:hypothetical protein